MDEATAAYQEYQAERRERVEKRLRWVEGWRLKPDAIAVLLGRRVIGQDEAVRRMAVVLRGHVLRMQEAIRDDTVLQVPRRRGESGPVLVIGESGSGKTHMIRSMAQMTSLPCSIEDATSQSSTGYVGRSVSDALGQLMVRAEAEIGLARWGILAIDEFDKVRRRETLGGVDVSGEGVQRCLLSLLDGGTAQVEWPPGGSRSERTWLSFSTANLMPVLAGAFQGLDDVIRRRLGIQKRRMGFGIADGVEERQDILGQAMPEDLVEYGFIEEIVGRLTQVVVMRPLARDDLRRILMEAPDGPSAQQQRIAEREGFRFAITDALADAIVTEAMSRGLGARSLHTILARVTQRALYEVPAETYPPRQTLRTVELGLDALRDGSYTLLPTRRRRARAVPAETTPDVCPDAEEA